MSMSALFPPGDNFRRAIGDRLASASFIDLDLSTARNWERIPVAGSYMFADLEAFDDESTLSSSLSTGHVFVRFGKAVRQAVYMDAGRAYQVGPNDPFDEIYVKHPAQASAMLRLYYASGPLLIPYQTRAQVTGSVGAKLGTGMDAPIFDGNMINNMTSGQILATTGDLSTAGKYLINWSYWISATSELLRLRHRNSSDVIQNEMHLQTGSGTNGSAGQFLIDITADDDIVIQASAAISARCSGYLSAVRLQ